MKITLVFLVCVFCIEAGFAKLHDVIEPRTTTHVRLHAIEDAIDEGPYDILVLGDSAAAKTVSPRLFAEISNKKVYNLGSYSRMTAVADIFFLEQYLKKHPPPEFVFVVRSFRSWQRDLPLELFSQFFSRAHIISLLLDHKWISTEQALSFLATRHLPSLQYSWEFKNRINWKLFPNTMAILEDTVQAFHNRTDHGFDPIVHPADIEASVMQEAQKEVENMHLGTKLKLYRHNDVLTRRLCKIAEENEFIVAIMNGPHIHSSENELLSKEVFDSLEGYAIKIAEEEPGCAYVYGINKTYSPRYMNDPVHPNLSGAYIFTADLARTYNNFLRSQR